MPIAIYDRYWLVRSLAQLGRFVEAAQYEAEALRLAEPTRHRRIPVGAGPPGRELASPLQWVIWAQARSLIEHGIAAYRTGNIVLNLPQRGRRLRLGPRASRRGKRGADPAPGGRAAPRASRRRGASSASTGEAYHALGRAALRLGRLDEARSLGDRALTSSPSRASGYAAHASCTCSATSRPSPDRFDAESGEAHYRKALALAEPRGMRPLVAHCHLGLGKLYRRTGEREQAQEHLTTATTMYREMDMRFWLEQAEAEMRELA